MGSRPTKHSKEIGLEAQFIYYIVAIVKPISQAYLNTKRYIPFLKDPVLQFSQIGYQSEGMGLWMYSEISMGLRTLPCWAELASKTRKSVKIAHAREEESIRSFSVFTHKNVKIAQIRSTFTNFEIQKFLSGYIELPRRLTPLGYTGINCWPKLPVIWSFMLVQQWILT